MNFFEFSEYFFFFIPIILYLIYSIKNPLHKNKISINLPNITYQDSKLSNFFSKVFPYLRFLGLSFLLIALVGPGRKSFLLPEKKNAIDIMLALDISASMTRSRDFLPKSRLEVSKILLKNFIEQRQNDRLGLVIFSGAAYLQSPLTNDKFALKEILSYINEGYIEEQGTAIGDAVLLSTFRLKDSKAKSRILILMTDGVSNTGKIDSKTATEISKRYQIKIYSIGIGREDGQFDINFDALKEISESTNGSFFRAETPSQLRDILSTIDKLEKTEINVKPKQVIEREFEKYLLIAIFLFSLELLLRSFVFRYYY